ncbi:GGDEF domain-containing protein [Sporosarcina soli]|uniref:GGDEF domain-containing protein n=1 Tax=Sporosarcina soli TaxID=334736 RepID=A0ABW0TN89_9BACL
MNKYFRMQLTLILIAFSLAVSFVIAFFDYGKLKERVRIGHETEISLVEDKIVESLTTIDNVYNLMDYQIADEMKAYSDELLALYEKENDFERWDFQALKERFGMDIYVIDTRNQVVYSSFEPDIGLDFNKCCSAFSKLLNERRAGAEFSHDGLDLQQYNGEIKKFSYVPTPDNHYLLELGISLENHGIFEKFNFIKTMDTLKSRYESVNSIQIYNSEGFRFGETEAAKYDKEITPEMRPLLREAVLSGKVQKRVQSMGKHRVTYRYIPYNADEKRGISTQRVIEIIYNDAEFSGLLGQYRNEFIQQLMLILIGAISLSFLIARLVARPIHLAFHDSLTGLKNRVALEEEVHNRLEKKQRLLALMMVDLDNFKTINDSLGHGEGDRILQLAAKTIQEIVGEKNLTARIGGDEFVVIFSDVGAMEIRQLASKLIEKINESFDALGHIENLGVSISIGIAVATGDDRFESLYEKADRALYLSKENGKNQYTFYNGEQDNRMD